MNKLEELELTRDPRDQNAKYARENTQSRRVRLFSSSRAKAIEEKKGVLIS
jgi:hypothetical protein